MAILRNRRIESDPWRHVPDGEPLPAAGPVTVSLGRWLAEREALAARSDPLGVRLGPEDPVDALAGDLGRLALVAIEFPSFAEGRGYSQARLLRERHGFRGELRARGDVGRDRLAFLERCGFDAFELRPGEDPAAALAALEEIPVVFQPGADRRPFAARLRGLR